MQYSIVIPTYNNYSTIQKTYEMILESFSNTDFVFEIIFIIDGSTDESVQLINTLKAKDKRICIIQFDKNYGQVTAIYAGMLNAKGKYSILISADLQEEKTLILKYVEQTIINKDTDLFIAIRYQNNDFYPFRIMSKIFYYIIRLKVPDIPKGGFDNICIRNDLKSLFIQHLRKDSFGQILLFQLANKITYVPYLRQRSGTPKIYWKSILSKIKYFIAAINHVYFEKISSENIITYKTK